MPKRFSQLRARCQNIVSLRNRLFSNLSVLCCLDPCSFFNQNLVSFLRTISSTVERIIVERLQNHGISIFH